MSSDNEKYCVVDGVLYTKDMKNLVCVLVEKTGEFAIPNSVTSIGDEAFNYCVKLASVVCEAITPPIFDVIFPAPFVSDDYDKEGEMFYNFDIPLYVPAESVEKYKVAAIWKKFKTILPIPTTSVEGAVKGATQAEKTEVARYNIAGKKLTAPTEGVNIVTYSDGSVEKEFRK